MLKTINFYRFYIVFNGIKNMHFIISNQIGNILFKKTSGSLDNSSKIKMTTIFNIIEIVNHFCLKNNIQHVVLFFLGNSIYKFSMIKDIFYKYFIIHKVYFVSTRVFNGCRKKKQRRLLFWANV